MPVLTEGRMSTTKIEWTERTWNPIVGCSIVSPGCTNCYAMRMAGRRLDGRTWDEMPRHAQREAT